MGTVSGGGGLRPVVKFQKLAKDTRRSVRVFSISVLVLICIAKTEGYTTAIGKGDAGSGERHRETQARGRVIGRRRLGGEL